MASWILARYNLYFGTSFIDTIINLGNNIKKDKRLYLKFLNLFLPNDCLIPDKNFKNDVENRNKKKILISISKMNLFFKATVQRLFYVLPVFMKTFIDSQPFLTDGFEPFSNKRITTKIFKKSVALRYVVAFIKRPSKIINDIKYSLALLNWSCKIVSFFRKNKSVSNLLTEKRLVLFPKYCNVCCSYSTCKRFSSFQSFCLFLFVINFNGSIIYHFLVSDVPFPVLISTFYFINKIAALPFHFGSAISTQ